MKAENVPSWRYLLLGFGISLKKSTDGPTCVTKLRLRSRGSRALRGPRDFSPRENAAKGSDSVQPVPASGLRAADEISS